MNSHQRRRSRRYWRYEVVMDHENDHKDPWDARCWLEDNMGQIGIRWGNMGIHPWLFFFHNSQDASFFSLKWS
jgi:hypothetical protein